MIAESKLAKVFGYRAAQAREILDMTRAELERLPVAAELRHPTTSDLRLAALDQLAGTNGIESALLPCGEWLDYLDPGDPYIPTITRWRNRYRVEPWGVRFDILERKGLA